MDTRRSRTLAGHVNFWKGCKRCPRLCGNRHVLWPRGVSELRPVLFLGEAPGVEETIDGEPFVGRSGRLLDSLVSAALEMTNSRLRVVYQNVVACMPRINGVNQPPSEEEVVNCRERLEDLVRLIQPHALVLVGKVAAKAVRGTKKKNPPIPELAALMPDQTLEILHPAFLLRQGGEGSVAASRERLRLEEFFRKIG